MKKILMLGTGGTIASEITESGLSPQLTTEQILHYCPDISGFCSVDCKSRKYQGSSAGFAVWTACSCAIWIAPTSPRSTGSEWRIPSERNITTMMVLY